jgi:hypothetical protein
MKPLIFCLLVSTSFVLQCILINSAQNITDKTSQVISIFLLCMSLVFLSAVFILWVFSPFRPRSKLPLIFLSLNFIISLTSNAIFSIFYHQKYSVPYIFPIFSFLYTVISIGIYLLFERSNVDEGPSRITPLPKEQINIELKTTTFTLDEPSSCSICIEEFIKDEEVKITPCNHLFHLQCSKDLVNNNIKNCPVCRGDLTLSIESVQESHRTIINISPSP